ncbi:Protein R53.2 [Aphelenchoides avenae]|nr:Protein R53.2 [Aphelenchus avenae]
MSTRPETCSRGAFIALEGPAIGNFLRNAETADQDSEAIHLLFSANRWFLAQKVREDLARGVHVIADRYSFSGIAYSLAKGLDKTWVCAPELCLPRPDVVLFFDIGPAAAATRDGYGNEVLERTAFQHAVYDHMKGILNESYCQNVNASVTIEQVHASITEKIDKTLEAVADGMQLGSFTPTDFGI